MSAKRNGRTSKLVLPFLFVLMHDHACDKIRTRDLLVRSQTLYPAELRAHKRFSQTQVLYYRREGQMSSINLSFFYVVQELLLSALDWSTRSFRV